MKSILILLVILYSSIYSYSQQIGFQQDKFGLLLTQDNLGGRKSSDYSSEDNPGRGDNKILLEKTPYNGVIFEEFDIYKENIPIRNGHFLIVVDGYRRCLIEFENNYVKSIELYDTDGIKTTKRKSYLSVDDGTNGFASQKVPIGNFFGHEGALFEIAKSSNFLNLTSIGYLFSLEINESNNLPQLYQIGNSNLLVTRIMKTYHKNGMVNSITLYPKNKIPYNEIIILKYDEKQNPLLIDTNFTFIKSSAGYYIKISQSQYYRDEFNDKYYTIKLIKQLGTDFYFETIHYSKEGEIESQYTRVLKFDPMRGDESMYYDGAYVENNLLSKKTTITNYSAEKSIIRGRDIKNGEQIEYFMYPDKIESKSVFENDYLVGNALEYYSNGKIKSDFNYIKTNYESVQNGEQKEYYESGVLKQKQNYLNGKLISFEKYNPDGSILQKGTY